MESKIFPPFDASYFVSHLFWLAVCFGLFYAFIVRVVLPRIGGAIETRHNRIAADLEQAARMKAEADDAIAAYEKGLQDAQEEAKSVTAAALEEAKNKALHERKESQGKLDDKLRAAEENMMRSRDKALKEINSAAIDIAADIVQKVTRQKSDRKILAAAVEAVASGGVRQ